jgi:hypothetical protein
MEDSWKKNNLSQYLKKSRIFESGGAGAKE